MKMFFNVIRNVIISLWVIVAIIATVCLFGFNDHKHTVIGNNTFLIVKNNEFEPDFNKGDLIVVKNETDINLNEKVFFYDTTKVSSTFYIGEVTNKTSDNGEFVYEIDNNREIIPKVIGRFESVPVINNLGMVLNVLTSSLGFQFIILFPALFLVVYAGVLFVNNVKKVKKEG